MLVDVDVRMLPTAYGDLAVADTGGPGLPLLMIHGNSSCHQVFGRQFGSRLGRDHRLIAFDLPGHGRSSDATDPLRTYTRAGLADCAMQLLEALHVREAAVLGWSLGGHVAIEMLARTPGLKGLVLTGAPPVRTGQMSEGFVGVPASGLAGREELSPDEVEAFAEKMFGAPTPAFLGQAIARTDRRFRPRLFAAARAGDGEDQRSVVERARAPIAVINGADDPLIRLDYIDGVAFGNLWEGRHHRLPGVGHAPFWQAADAFNALLARFLADVGANG